MFDTRDVLRGVCEAIPPGARVDLPALLELARGVVRRDEAVPVLAPEGQRTWSTQELLSTEQAALDLVAARRAEGVGVVSDEVVTATLTAYELAPEQVALVQALTTSGAGVDIVVGPAGAGKTHALRAAREAWERAGHPVLGTALAAIAARELERGAGIRATSLARLLGEVDRSGLPPGAILVVDEASMVGTRQLARLLGAAFAARAKVVLVGDPCQLPEIEAGGLFAALARTPAAITLTDNQRQAEPWERAALIQLRNGDVETALVSYAAQNRIHLAATVDELNKRIVADLLVARCASDGDDAVILTSRRVDATRLNVAVRDYLRAHGLLGESEIQVSEGERARAFSSGDEVVVTRNDYARGLLNGTRGVVTAVDSRGRWLQLTTRDGATVRVGAGWAAGRLDHAYAITCHRAQGMTIDTALLYGTAALCREAGYVAMSRGRRANHVYASADSHDAEHGCDIDAEVTMEPVDEARLVEQAASALTELLTKSRRQRLAHEHRPDRHLEEVRARGDEGPAQARSRLHALPRAM